MMLRQLSVTGCTSICLWLIWLLALFTLSHNCRVCLLIPRSVFFPWHSILSGFKHNTIFDSKLFTSVHLLGISALPCSELFTMCNLLLPLCPFVLHSLSTSEHSEPEQVPSSVSRDAQILFSYLSKRPYPGSPDQPSQASPQRKPLALQATQLYKRTDWHTCPCFFQRVSVLHPLPGPSKPIFGPASQYCARCSAAARPLRPMRLGGVDTPTTRNDPYWNRCIFAGVSEDPDCDNDDGNGNESANRASPVHVQPIDTQVQPSPSDKTIHVRRRVRQRLGLPSSHRRSERVCREEEEYPQPQQWLESRRPSWVQNGDGTLRRVPAMSPPSRLSHQSDLDDYLASAYGPQGEQGQGHR